MTSWLLGNLTKLNLESMKLLRRIEDANLRWSWRNISVWRAALISWGRIYAEGLHPLEEKVKAIQDAPAPASVQEFKSYLGLIAYYSKFMPNLSTVLHPLYKLLWKSSLWKWGCTHSLQTDSWSILRLSLSCDASAYGLGVVLSHKMPNGDKQPIAYASCTLSDVKRNYSQLEKEGLV